MVLKSNEQSHPDPWEPSYEVRNSIQAGWQHGDLVSLLGVYAGQAGSYTTLLWQVPALSFTGQSFLLTIALMHGNGRWAGVIAAVLSFLIALGSLFLLHQHRGHAINHMIMAGRVSHLLSLKDLLGTAGEANGALSADDAVPLDADAETMWDVDHWIYHLWRFACWAFLLADVVIMAVSLDVHRILSVVPAAF
jgi:hypothetical protein